MPGRAARVDENREALKLAAGFDLLAPAENVVGIECDTKHVGWNEAQLGGVERDFADQNAVDGREEPSLPALLAEEDGGGDGEHAGDIVQTKHGGGTYRFAGNREAGDTAAEAGPVQRSRGKRLQADPVFIFFSRRNVALSL